jgi:hypothetical protein
MLPPALSGLKVQLQESHGRREITPMPNSAEYLLRELNILDSSPDFADLLRKMNPLPPGPTGGKGKCQTCGCDLNN